MRLRPSTGTLANFAIRASKNYVIARASLTLGSGSSAVTATPQTGYEGIFLTVAALKATTGKPSVTGKAFDPASGNGQQPLQIFGSDSTSPVPTTAGFPLLMQSSDLRFMKLLTYFQSSTATAATTAGVYWATTEIVSNWFIQYCSMQNGASPASRAFQSFGETGRWLTGGYGDMTYSFNQDSRN
jgi:hypothetical protein